MDAAKEALSLNWRGGMTVPARGLYPHQWAWDSGLIAIGYSHYDQEKAQQELLSLFKGQWDNGLLPHMVFNPAAPDYFPGKDYWNVGLNPAAKGRETSGCIQPPVQGISAYAVYHNAKKKGEAKDFLREIYPGLVAWHDYLYRERDPEDEGLVYIRHPWESGRDNSPVWDEILARMQFERGSIPRYARSDTENWAEDGRPSDEHYHCYIHLCEIFKECRYDEVEIRKRCPFLVQDLLFNTILCENEERLGEIARILGEDPRPFKERAEGTRQAMRNKFWRDDHFLPYDLVRASPLQRHEIGGFAPLYAGVPSKLQAERLRNDLDSHYFCSVGCDTCYAVASYSRHDIDYNPYNYWRGPVWLNINWIVAQGLMRYGFDEHARWIIRSLCELPMRNGFRERYNADTGEPQGGVAFSWSAALFLDCYYRGWFNDESLNKDRATPWRNAREGRA